MCNVLVDRPVIYFKIMIEACLTEVCLSYSSVLNYVQVSADTFLT